MKRRKFGEECFGCKVSAETSNKKRQQQINSRHKIYNSDKSKFLANYIIYITNIAEEEISSMELFEIYKSRWTIELMFKEWKQNFDLK
ncbi:MAG: transposase [Saprospiraceae bacterium]|nr:transposase [Saprospiraceae bacterium]